MLKPIGQYPILDVFMPQTGNRIVVPQQMLGSVALHKGTMDAFCQADGSTESRPSVRRRVAHPQAWQRVHPGVIERARGGIEGRGTKTRVTMDEGTKGRGTREGEIQFGNAQLAIDAILPTDSPDVNTDARTHVRTTDGDLLTTIDNPETPTVNRPRGDTQTDALLNDNPIITQKGRDVCVKVGETTLVKLEWPLSRRGGALMPELSEEYAKQGFKIIDDPLGRVGTYYARHAIVLSPAGDALVLACDRRGHVSLAEQTHLIPPEAGRYEVKLGAGDDVLVFDALSTTVLARRKQGVLSTIDVSRRFAPHTILVDVPEYGPVALQGLEGGRVLMLRLSPNLYAHLIHETQGWHVGDEGTGEGENQSGNEQLAIDATDSSEEGDVDRHDSQRESRDDALISTDSPNVNTDARTHVRTTHDDIAPFIRSQLTYAGVDPEPAMAMITAFGVMLASPGVTEADVSAVAKVFGLAEHPERAGDLLGVMRQLYPHEDEGTKGREDERREEQDQGPKTIDQSREIQLGNEQLATGAILPTDFPNVNTDARPANGIPLCGDTHVRTTYGDRHDSLRESRDDNPPATDDTLAPIRETHDTIHDPYPLGHKRSTIPDLSFPDFEDAYLQLLQVIEDMTEADSDACHLLESAAQLLHDDETHSKTEKLLALSSVLLVENRRVRTFDGYTDLLSRLNKQLRRLGIEKKKNEHVTALSGEFFVDKNVGRLSAMLVKREGRFDGVVVIPDLNWEVRFSLVPNGRAGQYIVDDSQPVSVTSLTTRRVVAAGISLERNEDNTSEFNLVFRGETAISVFIMGTESRVERGVYPVFHEINTNADSKLILDALVTRSAKIIAPDMRVIMGRLLSRNSLAAGTGFTAQYRLLCANGDVITVSQKVDQSGVRIKKIEASALWHDLHLGTVSTMTVTQKGNALVLTGGGSNQEIIIPLTTAQTRMASHLLDLDKIEMRRRG